MPEATLPSSSSRWRAEWSALLDERDRISCLQSGRKGPPFAPPADATWLALSRWLPWNWYSLDGTGWCYDSSWDELKPCGDMDAPVDWNGVSSADFNVAAARHTALSHLQLFVLVCVAIALAARRAYQTWSRQQARRHADEEEEAPPDDPPQSATSSSSASEATAASPLVVGVRAWLRSGSALPSQWDSAALLTLGSAILGLLAAVSFPLPAPPDAWSPWASGADDSDDLDLVDPTGSDGWR